MPENGKTDAAPAAPTEPKIFTDLGELEKDTTTYGRFIRPKNEPIEIVLASSQIEKLPNRWGRHEYRIPAYLVGPDGKFDSFGEPQLLSLSRRGANKLAKALKGNGGLSGGLRLRLKRVGAGFDTNFEIEHVKAPA